MNGLTSGLVKRPGASQRRQKFLLSLLCDTEWWECVRRTQWQMINKADHCLSTSRQYRTSLAHLYLSTQTVWETNIALHKLSSSVMCLRSFICQGLLGRCGWIFERVQAATTKLNNDRRKSRASREMKGVAEVKAGRLWLLTKQWQQVGKVVHFLKEMQRKKLL